MEKNKVELMSEMDFLIGKMIELGPSAVKSVWVESHPAINVRELLDGEDVLVDVNRFKALRLLTRVCGVRNEVFKNAALYGSITTMDVKIKILDVSDLSKEIELEVRFVAWKENISIIIKGGK